MAPIALLLWILPASPPSEEPAPLETKIASVTVYGDRALVVRKGEAELADGVRRFTIGKLPAGVSDDSVRLKVGRGAMVVGVEVRQKTDREAASAAFEELRRKRAEVARALDAAKDEVATLEAAREYITALRAASAEKISKGMVEGALDPAKWGDGLKFVSSNLTENAKDLREARYRTAGLQEELAALDQKIGSVQGGQLVPYKEAVVSIAAGGTGKAPVEVEYLIGGAGWRPVYDLRAAEDFSGVALAYRAAVRQRTGEDWGEVEMTLSTARPQLGASPPPLQTMRLVVAPPPGAEERRAFPPAAAAGKARGEEKVRALRDAEGLVAADEAKLELDSLAPAAPSEAAVEERGISIQFHVPRAETVPADGEEHVVLVSESTIDVRPEHSATPKSAARVFLKGKAKNTTAFPILAGIASVYFGPDFVGRAPLRDIRPGEEFDLFLGQDPGVTVERKKVKEFREGP
ncbi:MAG TPA: mucoidy inhibitor MuiA family protein, partial [Planctomycetota bacterium]|nr:mucoidy inhibitor MuiA family protein [Planctomycetota bacterium]